MSKELSTAFLLLAVGMITVFLVLFLVVLSGKMLIRLVNRLSPSPIAHRKTTIVRQPTFSNKPNQIAPSKLAAIITAVEITTHGKGQIRSIEKINS